MTIAFVFPGQGSQAVGMGKALAETFAPARQVFDEVDAALGEKLSETMWNGPAASLTLTENAQPALMAVSLATLRVLEAEAGVDLGRDAAFVAGHSLGEYSALAAAQSLTLADAARLLRIRGRAMQKAVPVGVGAMAALVGVKFDEAKAIAAEAGAVGVCAAANDNGGGQVVLSGEKSAVESAVEIAKAQRRETGDDVAGVRAVSLRADGTGGGCHGAGACLGHRQAAYCAACRQRAGAADQRSGDNCPKPGRAGDRHGALARVGCFHGAGGGERVL